MLQAEFVRLAEEIAAPHRSQVNGNKAATPTDEEAAADPVERHEEI